MSAAKKLFSTQTQREIFNFLERPSQRMSVIYHAFILTLISGSVVIGVVNTMEDYEEDEQMRKLGLVYELVLLALVSMEFVLRILTCGVHVKYRGCLGRLQYMKTFYMMIDLIVILSTAVSSVLHSNAAYFTFLRFARFLQVVRILRLDRTRGDLRTMWCVVREHKKELVTCYFSCFLLAILGSYLLFLVERKPGPQRDDNISNMGNSLYWGIITFTSVGYGDYVPTSWKGKLLTAFFASFGCAFFSLPSGIIGSGFALQVAKEKKLKKFMKRRNPAALVIQSAWRNYALQCDHVEATWYYIFPHLHPDKSNQNNNHQNHQSTNDSDHEQTSDESAPLQQRKTTAISAIFQRSYTRKASVQKVSRLPTLPMLDVFMPGKEHEGPVGKLFKERVKISARFIYKLKLLRAIDTFQSTCQAYVNVEALLRRNIQVSVDFGMELKEMNYKFDRVLRDMRKLKYEMTDIKNRQLRMASNEKKDSFSEKE